MNILQIHADTLALFLVVYADTLENLSPEQGNHIARLISDPLSTVSILDKMMDDAADDTLIELIFRLQQRYSGDRLLDW